MVVVVVGRCVVVVDDAPDIDMFGQIQCEHTLVVYHHTKTHQLALSLSPCRVTLTHTFPERKHTYRIAHSVWGGGRVRVWRR